MAESPVRVRPATPSASIRECRRSNSEIASGPRPPDSSISDALTQICNRSSPSMTSANVKWPIERTRSTSPRIRSGEEEALGGDSLRRSTW